MSLHPDFVHELRRHFAGEVCLDDASRILYSSDASMYQIEPLGVAIPKTQDDLQAALELAAKYKVPVLPRGSGSSLGGQAIGEALILDCSRWLDSIIEIDPEAHTATVEPGVVLSALNAAVAKHGLTFGPDPASAERATMGGVIGNNATGAHSILYGMSADHVISADVILGDGSLETWDTNVRSKLSPTIQTIREKYTEAIKQNYPRSWRNSAGYRLNYLLPWSPSVPSQWDANDYGLAATVYHSKGAVNLASLLAGSEGTLAVMRRATVNLVPKPKHTILGVLTYDSITEACDDVPRLLEFEPSAIELVPRMIMQLARSVPAYARQMGWVIGDPAAVLVVEFSGAQPSALKEAARSIGEVLTIAESEEEQARVWNIRKMGLGILDSRPQAARPAAFIEDCAIPVERLSSFIREIERIMAEHHIEGGIYAHASAGCLHIRPILNLQSGAGVRSLRSIGEQVLALTLRLGGSMSSEHGDGIVAGEWIERTYGREVTEAMRLLKHAADPDNLLNPNKLFDAPPMDTHLRFGESYQVHPWNSALHFEHERGLAGAIEQCNGQGVCRKTTGVMCPSFQATREEMHSTRGRANLLRALISDNMLLRVGNEVTDEAALYSARGLLPEGRNAMTEAVYEALDLCLGCKGCKGECPSGVDMAKLKYEFEHQYYRSHRRQLRDYVFGYFHVAAKLASSIAPLSNAVTGIPLLKSVMARVLGITEERPFPKFSSKRAKVLATESTESKNVVFLSDPFARYVEPDVEQAAFDVLSLCGYDVQVLPVIGAGASLLSKGLIDAAKRHAGKVLDALDQIDPKHEMMVVGIEPPELYCLKHDYFDLLPERKEEIRRRVEKVWLLDEFLLRSDGFLDLRVGTLDNHTLSESEQSQISNSGIASSSTFATLRVAPRNDGRKVRFQPHCHQRAEGLAADGLPSGTAATVEVLQRCGYEVEVLDTGCCGMAGTFGYEAEHYELSMKVGELKLFPLLRTPLCPPPLRDASPKYRTDSLGDKESNEVVFEGGWVGATGAACRMQIRQGAGVEALHPIMLVAEALRRR